ncbi:Hypothetical protein MCYN_0842 [Mycoplasmopsis cynos C142]|uniref:Uncharacterized protein n=1 Tax=Mycoplasmopsis cynos (strain C142) TaxID=1246955 RepID=L0RVC2_MYCC1|nr:Hypothetical protein MCYN_0842 [Mycoplasmopsis cynos C142]
MLKAKELLPLPLRPVKTMNLYLGISNETFLRLFSFAPVTIILLFFWSIYAPSN